MEKNIKINFQHFLKRAKSQELLLKRTAHHSTNFHIQDAQLIDLEVYSIFKPILSKCDISKNEYMNNENIREKYLNIVTKLHNEYRRNQEKYSQYYQDIYNNGEINSENFCKLLNQMAKEWSLVYGNANSKNPQKVPGLEMKNITLREFFCLDPKTRINLSKIATEKTYPYDCDIYNAYQKDLEWQKGIPFIEFIQNPRLKEEYRQKTEQLRRDLSKQQKEEVSFSTAIDKVSLVSAEWYEYLSCTEEAIGNGGKIFASNYPIEKFCMTSNNEKKEIESIITKFTVKRIKNKGNDLNDSQREELNKMLAETKQDTASKVEQR